MAIDRVEAVLLLDSAWPTSKISFALLLDETTIRNYNNLSSPSCYPLKRKRKMVRDEYKLMNNILAPRVVLGLDVGNSHIGLALSDSLGITAQPYLTLENRGRATMRTISEVIAKNKVRTLVVGLPLELDGAEGEQAAITRRFVDKLSRYLSGRADCSGIQVEFIDERLSSVQAERVLRGSGLKNMERREALDKISAALILETYLNITRAK